MPDEVQTEEVLAKSARRAPGSFEFIRHQVEGPVARLTLHRPEHNLLNEQMLRELANGIGMVAENGAVKLIVLDAAGKVFSAGVDIGEYTGERAFSMLAAFHAACIALVEAPQPVLVIVDGAAIGGGAELVAYGDLVIATPRARFALPEITIGMSLRDSLKNSMNIFLNELYRLEDSQEGLRALLEKRKPQWKNR